ncbi:MAG TPA: hypothetical protein VG938_13140 [Verrucomicrobiae bacterium]|jgi:hypothetical protein|nr:hypothetical protein [Verrucomicrobiae bacterium]
MNKDNQEMNEAVMKQLRSSRWAERGLVTMALGFGLLAIFGSIMLAWANVIRVHPMERLLMEDYPQTVQQTGTNAEGNVTLSRQELDWRHVQVTAAHGKVMFLTAVSMALLSMGTLVILLLVIFNRRITLRQINASLAQISEQIKALQQTKCS